MANYRPSNLHDLLQEIGASPSKSLSQNFLIDGNIIRKTIALADVNEGDHVIEIGPGPGTLTELLLKQGAHVTAIEKDEKFATHLKSIALDGRSLTIFSQDFLTFDLELYLKNRPKKSKIVANLPYHLTTPILKKILPHTSLLESVTVMVQKEFAERITAKATSCNYSAFSIFVQYYTRYKGSFIVQPTSFFPPPKVHSTVIRLDPLESREILDEERFFEVIKEAFQQRRKMLRVSLKQLYSSEVIEDALSQISKDPKSRPEDLSLDDFLRFFHIVQQDGSNNAR